MRPAALPRRSRQRRRDRVDEPRARVPRDQANAAEAATTTPRPTRIRAASRPDSNCGKAGGEATPGGCKPSVRRASSVSLPETSKPARSGGPNARSIRPRRRAVQAVPASASRGAQAHKPIGAARGVLGNDPGGRRSRVRLAPSAVPDDRHSILLSEATFAGHRGQHGPQQQGLARRSSRSGSCFLR